MKETIQRFKRLENYFRSSAQAEPAFLPEYEAVVQINDIINATELTRIDLQRIVHIFNETNAVPHYDGSGWFDLRLHIFGLLRDAHLKYEPSSKGDIILEE